MKTIFNLLIIITLFLFPTSQADTVLKCYDGDTCTILTDNKEKFNLRLWGIDAPELKQNYGKEAKEFLNNLVKDKTVTIELKNYSS